MAHTWWRTFALSTIAIAVFVAFRDLVGFHDDVPVTNLTYAFHDHLWGFVRILMLAVATTVVWYGADRKQARILAGAMVGLALNNNWWFYAIDDPLLWPSVAVNYLGVAFGLTQFARFAATYGEGDWRRVRFVAARVAPWLGVFIALCGTLWWVSVLVVGDPRPVFNRLFWLGWDLVNVLVIGASLIAVSKARPPERTRMLWVAGSFLIAAFGTAIHGVDRAFQGETVWVNNVDTIAQAALPLGLGYAVLWQRVFDLDFIIDRITLFGILIVLVSGLFALADVLSETYLHSQHHIKGAIQLGLSVCVVLSFKRLERWTEALLEDWRARAAFGGFNAREYRNRKELCHNLRVALETYGKARAVAIYWREHGGGFEQLESTFPFAVKSVSDDDADVKALAHERDVVAVSGEHRLPRSLGFRMPGRGALQGFVLCEVSNEMNRKTRIEAIAAALTGAAEVFEELRVVELERRIAELEGRAR